jgi:hypothetical protein
MSCNRSARPRVYVGILSQPRDELALNVMQFAALDSRFAANSLSLSDDSIGAFHGIFRGSSRKA